MGREEAGQAGGMFASSHARGPHSSFPCSWLDTLRMGGVYPPGLTGKTSNGRAGSEHTMFPHSAYIPSPPHPSPKTLTLAQSNPGSISSGPVDPPTACAILCLQLQLPQGCAAHVFWDAFPAPCGQQDPQPLQVPRWSWRPSPPCGSAVHLSH